LRSIFINYRRSDSEGEAGRLFDDLTSRFGGSSVFMDVAAIEPGRDFRKAIDQSVADCSVLLAMIGLEWREAKDGTGGRRLDDPNDFVRIELASALSREIPVVPVLVRGAKMPRVEDLPETLKELAYRNAVELTHARWKSDVQVLIRALQPFMDLPGTDGSSSGNPSRELREGSPAPWAAAPMTESATAISTIDLETTERVSKELAAYIGPIAEIVVKRAAKRCSSARDLCATVAQEIEFEADRARFLRSCQN
jgi:hypothetical protein